MARNRQKTGSLTYQVKKTLDDKLAIGRSKHQDKLKGVAQDKIYSWSTYKTYMKHNNYFVKWAKETYGARTLQECRPYVDEWLTKRANEGLSAYTQKLEASALAKMYGCSTKDFVKTEVRHRADITRSRGEKVRDRHFSEERNKEFVEFCKSTGLRRSELQALTGDKLIFKEGKPYIVVDKGTKGGRYREAPVIGNKELVIQKMQSAGSSKVFDKIPNGADIHGYRSDYATSYYKSIARPIEDIPYDKVNKGSGRPYQSEVYHCRGDLKGVKYDKVAMLEVSRALGHNRISVIAGHYIRG
jgi:integrase